MSSLICVFEVLQHLQLKKNYLVDSQKNCYTLALHSILEPFILYYPTVQKPIKTKLTVNKHVLLHQQVISYSPSKLHDIKWNNLSSFNIE